ncbi:MAG TPA: S1C family serine protease, partial [Candidatus Nanoarchaeia archaeon]|nr:S1C family serine protease [Candidatus Nanoarchaeia archaeon]
VLKMKNVSSTRRFKYAKLAQQSGKIGDAIYVLGAPEGLEFSITKGIISQKDRDSFDYPEDKKYSKYLQTDAAANPGNSGGPIINEQGEVVGMTTWGYTKSEGLNFGLQSEIISDLYTKAFNETPKILQKTKYLKLHGSDSFTKEVMVSEPTNAFLITAGNEVKFDGVRIGIDNKKNSTVKLCFNDRLVTFFGIISYNRESDQTEELKPRSSKQIDHYPKITLESDYTHFYLVDIFDCDTRQAYGKVYGPGTNNG